MVIEFIIAHTDSDQESCCTKVRQAWYDAIEAEGEDELLPVAESMILPQQWRGEFEVADKFDRKSSRCILCFTLDTQDYSFTDNLIDIFIDNLKAEPIKAHVIRFEDSLFYTKLQVWFEEIFQIEMKIRRALSLIYLAAPHAGDPYNLLYEVQVTLQESRNVEEMGKHAENEFYHLLFSNYPSLNKRKPIPTNSILDLISNAADFAKLREEISRQPVEKEEDVSFLADLKTNTDPIEKMRNCVAHYRRPSNKILTNYDNAKAVLHTFLDNFLSQSAF